MDGTTGIMTGIITHEGKSYVGISLGGGATQLFPPKTIDSLIDILITHLEDLGYEPEEEGEETPDPDKKVLH